MKTSKVVIIFTALFSIVNYVRAQDESVIATTARTITPCDRNDLDLDQCLKNLVQEQILLNINGSEALNLPSLEPWSLPRTKYLYTTSSIRMILTTENVKIHGLKRTTIVNVDTKFKNNDNIMSVEMMIHFPKVRMSGNYSANIRVNELKIRPRGRFNVTLINVINLIRLTGTIENQFGQKFLRLNKFSLDPKIEDIRFNVTGIFPTDPQLNTVFVQFINSYWRNLYPLVIRETRTDWEPMLLNATNQFLQNFAFDNVITNKKLIN